MEITVTECPILRLFSAISRLQKLHLSHVSLVGFERCSLLRFFVALGENISQLYVTKYGVFIRFMHILCFCSRDHSAVCKSMSLGHKEAHPLSNTWDTGLQTVRFATVKKWIQTFAGGVFINKTLVEKLIIAQKLQPWLV